MINLSFYQQRLEGRLTEYLESTPLLPQSDLKEAINYSSLAVGKRFRPILVYLGAKTVGNYANQTESLSKEKILQQADSAACAIELMHIYSLIHDDLPAMDNDDLRHHKPSCHIVYGDAMAILAGDGLQSLSFGAIASNKAYDAHKKAMMLESLSQHSFHMVYGQALDLDSVNYCLDEAYLQKMHRHKTGALLRCSVALGAISANANSVMLGYLDDFAQALGLAYQVQDDVLDVASSNAVLGKQIGSDIANNKTTYVTLFGVDKAKKIFNQYYDEASDALNVLQTKYEAIEQSELQELVNHLRQRNF